MAPADDDVVGEKSTFRWLDAARYALAFVVTVLIVTVIAHAIVVVLRPEPLILRVLGGHVSTEPSPSSTAKDLNLTFRFSIQAQNPSGRVRIYYTNIFGYLRGKNASTSPAEDFISFYVPNMTVDQLSTVDTNMQVYGNMSSPYLKPYEMLYYNESSIPDVVLSLNGTLTIEVYSGHNRTGHQAIYCCSGLTVGGDSSDLDTPGDVLCTEKDSDCDDLST